jgi:hypothetical protein
MLKSFKSLTDPRVFIRIIMGALLVGNLVAAVIAFHPFGGSADDLQHQRDSLQMQLERANTSLKQTGELAGKVQAARQEGDKFMDEYILDRRTAPYIIGEELNRIATLAQIKPGPLQFGQDAVEGSDTLEMWSISMGFEGDYGKLAKFVELIDKSPKFLILDNLQAAAPQTQGGKVLNATVKIKTFVRTQNQMAENQLGQLAGVAQ